MSLVIESVEDVWDAVTGFVDDVIDAIGDILETLWKDVLMPAFEFIAGIFGIKDKDIIETFVHTQRIIEEDITKGKIISKIALEEMKDDVGIIKRLMAYSEIIRKRYSAYFNYGRDEYVDGLPDVQYKTLYVKTNVIKAIISAQVGTAANVTEASLGALNKYTYAAVQLQRDYAYKPSTGIAVHNGYRYKLKNVDFNYSTGNYDLTVGVVENVVTKDIRTVTTSVVSETTGTPPNTVTVYHVTVNTTVKRIVEGTISGVQSDVEISNTTSNYDSSRPARGGVVVTQTVVSTQVDITPISIKPELIGIVFISTVVSYPAYPAVGHYSVKYYTTDANDWYWWIYQAGSGLYPELDINNKAMSNLEMLPVVTLRNATVSVTSDKESVRYKQAKEMLNFFGINIDTMVKGIEDNPDVANIEDAFIHMGMVVKDTSTVMSKILYKAFDFLYDSSDLTREDTKFMITFKEVPFNAAIAWADYSKVDVVGSIGTRGTYLHSVVGKDLVLKWQDTDISYKELRLINLSSTTFIDRGGLVGTVLKDVDADGFFIPLSMNFVKELSPLEQYELFNRTLLLSIYGAQVIHLEWYETEEFMNFIKIVAIVITVISFGTMAWTNGIAYAISTTIFNLAIALGASLVLKLIFEATDSEFIRVLATLVYAYVMTAYVGGVDLSGVMSSTQLINAVTLFASSLTTGFMMDIELKTEEFEMEKNAFGQKLQEAEDELDKAKEALVSFMDVGDVTDLMLMSTTNAYLEGVDAMMYRAIGAQYDTGLLYDYDRLVGGFVDSKLRIGIL